MKNYLSKHPTVVVALIVAVAVCIVAALLVGADLAWLPSVVRGLVGQ